MNFFEKFNKLKNKNQIKSNIPLMLFIGSFALLLVVGSTSYAYLTDTQSGTLINTVSAGNLSLTLDNESDGITLNRAVPQLDSDALENNEEYTFTLTNNGNVLTHYEVILTSDCSTSNTYTIDETSITPDICIPNEYIKVGVSKNNEDYQILTFDNNTIILDAGTIGTGNSINYTVKIWLDIDTPNDYSALDEEGNERNVLFSASLNVTGEQINNYTPDYCFSASLDETTNTAIIGGYDVSCGTDVVIPVELPVLTSYTLVENPTEEAISNCITEFVKFGMLETVSQTLCNGGDVDGLTLESILSDSSMSGTFGPLLIDTGMLELTTSEELYTVTAIGYSAFSDNNLTSVTIPDSVTTIYESAFSNNNLTSVAIPDSVISLSGFDNNKLTKITIPDSVTTIAKKAFDNNSLTSVTLGNNVKNIYDSTFSNNNLTSITIPDSVEIIGVRAFQNNNLTSVTIPDSVTSIGDYAFMDNNLESVTLGNSVRNIYTYAFQYNNLTSIEIPDSVTTIGDDAFSYNNLTSIEIPDSVISIGYSAFSNNSLTSVTLGNNVQTIGAQAFFNNNLTSVEIPDSITTIENHVFAHNNLTSITFGNNVTSIGIGTFRENNLTSVIIPDSITTIGYGAFYRNNLSYVVIGENSSLTETTGIGQDAFSASNATVTSNGTTYVNNPNLTIIYNNSEKAFKWIYAINGSDSTTTFDVGTVPSYTDSYGYIYNEVLITTGTPE